MPSIDRPLSGRVLVHDLAAEGAHVLDATSLARSGRNARTVLKDGALRVTLIAVEKGAEIPPHSAEGPITIQPLRGRIRFQAGGEEYLVGPGELLSAPAGLEHSVVAEEQALFLLTI
jgi:quercetin dioxygenase-like cupin family protein